MLLSYSTLSSFRKLLSKEIDVDASSGRKVCLIATQYIQYGCKCFDYYMFMFMHLQYS